MIFPSKFINGRSVTITSETKTDIETYGGVTQVGKLGNQHHWRIMFTTKLLTAPLIREFNAFVNRLDGRYKTCEFRCPVPYLGVDKSCQVYSSASAGQDTIQLKGLTPNQSAALAVGDYIKFANHDKVYEVSIAAVSAADGRAAIVIYPNLFYTVPANTALNEAVFIVRSTKDKNALTLNAKDVNTTKVVTFIEGH